MNDKSDKGFDLMIKINQYQLILYLIKHISKYRKENENNSAKSASRDS